MLEVIEEAPHWLAVHKAAGRIVERNPFESPSVEELVEQHLARRVRNPYVGVVHRLDKPVSGVLLFAKRRSALRRLHAAFREGHTDKRYLAVVEGLPPAPTGTLDHWLKRSPDRKRAIIARAGEKGAAPCRLEWRLLHGEGTCSLLEIKPQTGRFHQIRAQLALAGMPILGDVAYGSRQPWQERAIALHAWRLRFPYPEPGSWHEVSCLPKGEKWQAWLSRIS